MSFGTSILEGFRKGFGRVLGSQNPRFSHFFRYFFDANFRVQVGRAKNRKKSSNTPDAASSAADSMCCALTAAPKKEKYCHGECKNSCYCIKESIR